MSTAGTVTAPPIASSDAAWTTIELPFRARDVAAQCRDLEVLFRVNPLLHFSEWRQIDADTFHVRWHNESNDQELDTAIRRVAGPDMGFTVEYDRGLKRRTVFLLEDGGDGSRLTVVDDYDGTPAEERARRAQEVDRSLLAWTRALQLYFRRRKRWSWVPGWPWYMRRMWIPMKPTARRIVWLLYIITLAEFVVFLFVLLIYALEHNT